MKTISCEICFKSIHRRTFTYKLLYSGEANITSCVPCTPGSYCASDGLSEPTGLCDPGWYCTLGADLQQPAAPEGGMCVAGRFSL